MPRLPFSHSFRSAGRTNFLVVGLVAIAALGLAACSSSSQILPNVGGPVGGAGGASSGAYQPAASPAAGSGSDSGSGGGSGNGGSQARDPNAPNEPLPNEALIVKTGSMSVEVQSVDEALLKARTAIAGIGGYISGSDQSSDNGRAMASVTYRLPASRWEDALDALGKLGKVLDAKTQTTEVTGQVLDLGARIDNLKATEQALQSIMTKATKIPDILAVQQQLTQVQGEIEQLSTQQAHLRDQAAMSTLTALYQTPAVPVVTETTKAWSPSTEFDHAVGTILGIGQGLATFGIWLVVVVLPLLVALLLLGGIAALVLRRLGPSRIGPEPPAVMGGGGAA
ncbi:MAG TPA: DUF4349 domain-containing protein [Candidatus Acidoferrum sp.]|nr:DUF4349 domain-containing protein [Candidatus Acidoferrum sp.]